MEPQFVSPRSGRRSVMKALQKNRDKQDTPTTTELPATSHLSCDSSSHGSRRVVYRRPDGSTGISKTGFFEKSIESSDHRRSDVFASLRNLNLNGSFRDNKPKLIQKVTAYDLYDVDDDDNDSVINGIDSEAFDVGKEPQSCRSVNIPSNTDDLSASEPVKDESDPSVIQTSASDEQWANFKLLGRVGLGDVSVSKPAKRLIVKNVRVLSRALKQVMALRDDDETPMETTFDIRTGKLLDEVKVTLDVPAHKAEYKRDPKSILLGEDIEIQLKDYVTVISCMYRDNGFHNFEHASQVLKSANSILSFISISEEKGNDSLDIGEGSGVITDPWTHFALIFSALVHDVDHAGVPNAQLIKERSIIAGSYKDKSVAEQNSIDIAWNLLMEPCYRELREALFMSPEEVSRFRRLVVIFVLATDIADKELANLRKDRAQQALECVQRTDDIVSRRATYVMETFMQAADVSHTMQPFPIFKKWNHMLYREMYAAYENGRAEKDPTESWFRGDIGFFDFYIIPLAKKLVDCGVLDQSKAESLLNNAIANRVEWEKHGEEIVLEYIAERDTGVGLRSRGRSMDSTNSIGSFFSDLSAGASPRDEGGRVGRKSPRRAKKKSISGCKSPKKPSSAGSKGSKRKSKRAKRVDLPFNLPLGDSQHEEILQEGSGPRASRKSMKSKGKSETQRRGRSEDGTLKINSEHDAPSSPDQKKPSKKKGKDEIGANTLSNDLSNGMKKVHSEGNLLAAAEDIVLPTRSKPTRKSRSRSSGAKDKAEMQMFTERMKATKEAKEGKVEGSSPRRSRPRGSTTTKEKSRSRSTGALDKAKRDKLTQQQELLLVR